MYLAWRYGGADPYRLYNGLDEGYRPLAGDACPRCEGLGHLAVRHFIDTPGGPALSADPIECPRCSGSGVVTGQPRRPLFPARVKAFVMACALVAEREALAMAGIQRQRKALGGG